MKKSPSPKARISIAAVLRAKQVLTPAILAAASLTAARLTTASLIAAVLTSAILWLPLTSGPAHAQALFRVFPGPAELAILTPQNHPEILINQKPARLSPGALIRNTENRIVLLGSLQGDYVVSYTKDFLGEVNLVWMLTPAEIDREKDRIKLKRAAEKAAGAAAQ